MDSELEKMVSRVAVQVRALETRDEIAIASQFVTSMKGTNDDILKEKAFEIHIAKIGAQRVRADISIYRLAGQISSYYIGYTTKGVTLLKILEEVVQGWVRLASEGLLSKIEEAAGLGDGERESVAQRLRTFMIRYQQNNFHGLEWGEMHMKNLRYLVFKVIHDFESEADISRVNRISKPGKNDRNNGAQARNVDGTTKFGKSITTSLENSLNVREALYTSARERADRARAMYSQFDESIYEAIEEILNDGIRKHSRWDVNLARGLGERFHLFGTLVRDNLERELIRPLVAEELASKALEGIMKEMKAGNESEIENDP